MDANYREKEGIGLWSPSGWQSIELGDRLGSIGGEEAITGDVAPLIGRGNALPYVAVVGGQFIVFTDDKVKLMSGTAMLINCSDGPLADPFPVFDGSMVTAKEDEQAILQLSKGAILANPAGYENQGYIDPSLGKIVQEYTSDTPVGNDSASLTQPKFTTSWSLDFRGWSSLAHNITLDEGDLPTVAGLQLSTDNNFQFDLSSPNPVDGSVQFTAIRASSATISQPPELGGASKPVQVLILPEGKAIPSNPSQFCTGMCIDLRTPDDTPEKPNRAWSMPDIHTNIAAGTVLMSRNGEVLAFSKDHPAYNAQELSKEFSFDAFNATVSVDKKKCRPEDDVDVAVITGQGKITIPNIGAGGDAFIEASFTLCQTIPDSVSAPDSPPQLRTVHLAFSSSVGIPVGGSGLFVTGLSGTVDIAPTYSRITVGLDVQAAQGGNGGLLKGRGEVTIDTRGLFAFQGSAKILGTVDGSGKLWVGWNPLDVGFELEISFKDWLTGKARAHVWQGQGFGARYSWLPDNDDMHMAAQIEATFKIKKGAIFDWWFIKIPPGDISFSIEIAFGEFCTNSDCTSYEWGIKGTVKIAGYGIGIYYAFDSGFDFILGNDDHILIDQHNGAQTSPVMASSFDGHAIQQAGLYTAPAIINGVATIPITVTAEAENLLFAVGWQTGTPQLSLTTPADVELTEANASTYGAEFIYTEDSVLIGLVEPEPGVWQAKISNLSATGDENYKFVYFANKGVPGKPGNHGEFLAPIAENEDATGSYTLRWTVPPGTPPNSTISLYASNVDRLGQDVPTTNSQYEWEETPLVSTPMTPTNLALDIPIVQHLPFVDGQYEWSTFPFENGSYQVYGIVDDGINNLQRFSSPDNTCLPIENELPLMQAFDPERFPGTRKFTAVGTVQIMDTAPPAAPTGLSITAIDGAALAQWEPSPESDVAFYMVRWGEEHPDRAFQTENEQLITAASPRLRIGGLTNGVRYGLSVLALDVNENESMLSAPVFVVPDSTAIGLPSTPISFTLASIDSDSASFTWNAGSSATGSYRLVYAEVGTTTEFKQTELRTNATEAVLNELTTGASYEVFVTGLTATGWESAGSETIRFTVTSDKDDNNDGLPDDWAEYYDIDSGNADSDGDGLMNKDEFAHGTNPTVQDSDADDFSDGEEIEAGTDPYSDTSYPAGFTQTRLGIAEDEIEFVNTIPFTIGEPNLIQEVLWENLGGAIYNFRPKQMPHGFRPSFLIIRS